MNTSGRIQREKKTVEVMIRQYCRIKHQQQQGLCRECSELLAYARKRLDCCPFQEGKTTCGKCPVHCYQPEKREMVREVMRTIGPRMIRSNPIMGIMHALDGLRKKPLKKKRKG